MSMSSVLHRTVSGQQKKMSSTPLEQAGDFNSMDLLSSQDTWTLGTKTPRVKRFLLLELTTAFKTYHILGYLMVKKLEILFFSDMFTGE